jgi:hypothetical protein
MVFPGLEPADQSLSLNFLDLSPELLGPLNLNF